MTEPSTTTIDYNLLLAQLTANLSNACNTFGPASTQYQCILQMFRDCLSRIKKENERNRLNLEADTLSNALELLNIEEGR